MKDKQVCKSKKRQQTKRSDKRKKDEKKREKIQILLIFKIF